MFIFKLFNFNKRKILQIYNNWSFFLSVVGSVSLYYSFYYLYKTYQFEFVIKNTKLCLVLFWFLVSLILLIFLYFRERPETILIVRILIFAIVVSFFGVCLWLVIEKDLIMDMKPITLNFSFMQIKIIKIYWENSELMSLCASWFEKIQEAGRHFHLEVELKTSFEEIVTRSEHRLDVCYQLLVDDLVITKDTTLADDLRALLYEVWEAHVENFCSLLNIFLFRPEIWFVYDLILHKILFPEFYPDFYDYNYPDDDDD